MASVFSHAFVALASGKIPQQSLFTWRTVLLGMACSVVPDLDVIGFHFGIHYGELWGHRGVTHSLLFAALLSATLLWLGYRRESVRARTRVFLYLFACTASHGLLDAMTDGGLGVAFFSPFDMSRYFFSFRPIAVSPIGIGEFFNGDTLRVLVSEAQWIWFPTGATFVVLRTLQRLWSGQSAIERSRAD